MAREILIPMPEPTNPDRELGSSPVAPATHPEDIDHSSAAIAHDVQTSQEAQRQADVISAELAGMFPARVQTAPATPRVDVPVSTAPRLTRRAFAGGLVATTALAALGGLKFWSSRGTNAATSVPTPGFVDGSKVPGGPAGAVPSVDGGTPTAPRAAGILDGTATPTTDPNVLPALQTAEAKWGNAWNTAVAGVNTQTAQGPDRTVTPAATSKPDSTPVSSPNISSTPRKEGTATPESPKEFSVKVNIIRPGDKKYEDVFGPVQETQVKEVVLNDKFKHPSGLNAQQMQRRLSSYAEAAGRYADEWYMEQLRTTGKQPQGRPPDVNPENPTIKRYMEEDKPYTGYVWGGDRMFDLYRLAGDETLNPTLGDEFNIIPVTADIINKMRTQSIPVGVEVVYRTGSNNGRPVYNVFATPQSLLRNIDFFNRHMFGLLNSRQNPILTRGIRESLTPPNFADPNLIDMCFSTIQTDTAVPNTTKVGSPLETPLYIAR